MGVGISSEGAGHASMSVAELTSTLVQVSLLVGALFTRGILTKVKTVEMVRIPTNV